MNNTIRKDCCPNSMDKIIVKYLGKRKNSLSKEIPLLKFLSLKKKELNPFEQRLSDALKEIYTLNKENLLYPNFPRRKKPLIIDAVYPDVKKGWIGGFAHKQNKIFFSHDLNTEDLKLSMVHELKHAEQWFNDSKFNNYQRHQAFCLYEVLAKLFVGSFLGRGAYFNITLKEAINKWFDKHYLNYKEKYDRQWPLRRGLIGLKHLPKSFNLSLEDEKEMIEILNKKVLSKKS